MRIQRRIAIARREVKRLLAIATEPAAEAEGECAPPSFRLLTEAETAAMLGGGTPGGIGSARGRS